MKGFLLSICVFLSCIGNVLAQDMSAWSDQTVCRLVNSQNENAQYIEEANSRGLTCNTNAKAFNDQASSKNTIGFGLCESDEAVNETLLSDNSQLYSDKFNLLNHQLVNTALPAYRSWSFASLSPEVGRPPGPEIKAIADFNKDGIDDLVIDYYETSMQPLILFGSSSGEFKQLNYDQPTAERRHIRNGEAVDINQDGWIDFIGFTTGDGGDVWQSEGFSTGGRNISRGQEDLYLKNIEGKTFVNIPLPEPTKNNWTHGGTYADLNNDGLIDILPLSEDNGERKLPLINLGNDQFKLGKYEYSKDIKNYLTADAASGDFNKDGFDDFVVIVRSGPRDMLREGNNYFRTLRVIYGDGDADFRDNEEYDFGQMWPNKDFFSNIMAKEKITINLDDNILGNTVVNTLDIDSDGHLDILEGQYVVVNSVWTTSGFQFYRNTGKCFYNATNDYFPNQYLNRAWENNISTSFAFNFIQADINNDSFPDMILNVGSKDGDWLQISNSQAYPFIFMNHENKQFLPLNYYRSYLQRIYELDSLIAGDFNGDGITDLLGLDRRNGKVVINTLLAIENK